MFQSTNQVKNSWSSECGQPDVVFTISNHFLEKLPCGSLKLGSGKSPFPIGSMYGIYANIGGILMVNVTQC